MKTLKGVMMLLITTLLSIAILYTGCKHSDEGVVKIGVILPLSGDFAEYGNSCKAGIEFAVAEISENKRIDLFFEDSKGEAKTAISAFIKLLNRNNVDFVIGDMFSGTTLAIAPIANKNKVLIISPTASSKEIPETGIYSLSIFPGEEYEASLLANYSNSVHSRIGIFYELVAASETMKQAFENTFKNEIVFADGFSSDIQSYRNLIQRRIDSNIDALYLITYKNHAYNILKQMQELNFKPIILGQSALFDPDFIDNLNFLENDFILTGPSFSSLSGKNAVSDFFERFEKKFNQKPNQMSSQGYVSVFVGLDFLKAKKNQNFTEEFVKDYNLNTIIGNVKFNDQFQVTTGLMIYKYKEGTLSLIDNLK